MTRSPKASLTPSVASSACMRACTRRACAMPVDFEATFLTFLNLHLFECASEPRKTEFFRGQRGRFTATA